MSNRNNINSRLNKVNKQLLKLNGNNGGLNLKGLKSKLSLSKGIGGSSKVFIVIGVILLLIVLGVAGYFLYKYFTNKKVFSKSKLLIPYIHDAQINKDFPNSSIPKSASGNEYNINMWIYVNDYNYRHKFDKCILIKIDSKKLSNGDTLNGLNDPKINNGNPSIWLKKGENTLVVATGLDTSLKSSCVEDGTKKCPDGSGIDVDKCEIKNFPLQRWVNVNVSLRNNVLDIFMDGSLKKSCILSGSPTANAGDVYVLKEGGLGDNLTGFNGYISKLEYTNKALSTDQIMKRYKKGPTVKVSKGFLNIFK